MIIGLNCHLVLAIDPGAIRAGWAVLRQGDKPYVASGVVALPRPKDEPFQQYRLRLTEYWAFEAESLIGFYKPDLILSETVPPVGANNTTQMYLANVQITTVHAIAYDLEVEVEQISARTVQKAIAIKGNSRGITKPQVRNGVLARLPELQPRFKEFTKIFEETDALAIGLWYLEKAVTL